jgi:4,5-DOPA dioxygenase extradiol
VNRRTLILASAAMACSKKSGTAMESNISAEKSNSKMPVLFLAHGAPPLLEDTLWQNELKNWAAKLPKPKSILMISAHWENAPVSIGCTQPLPLVYDFYGFPEQYYQIQYKSPGAPELARQIGQLIPDAKNDETRGLDHGTYIPLMFMYPQADVPVIQLSMPSLDLKQLFSLGQSLAPLRDEGVLIMGSGFLTHNLRSLGQTIQPWATDFDEWVKKAIQTNDVDSLIDMQHKAPGSQLAHPRIEHYAPLVIAAGAASKSTANISFPVEGFWMGMSFTKRSVQYG